KRCAITSGRSPRPLARLKVALDVFRIAVRVELTQRVRREPVLATRPGDGTTGPPTLVPVVAPAANALKILLRDAAHQGEVVAVAPDVAEGPLPKVPGDEVGLGEGHWSAGRHVAVRHDLTAVDPPPATLLDATGNQRWQFQLKIQVQGLEVM